MARQNVVLQLQKASGDDEFLEDPIQQHESVIDAAALEYHDWNSLIQQCSRGLRSLKLLVRRDLLQHKSTYFRSLLGGDFRESSQDTVHMTWDMGTCCSLLQCMYFAKMEISTSNFQKLLEGSAFFGVDAAMSALLLHIQETTSSTEVQKCIPKFWSIADGMGIQSLSHACLDVFVVNFEDVIQEAGFEDLPSALLVACIDHRRLTVRSEKKLCEVVLNWFMYHQKTLATTRECLSCEDQSSALLKATCGGEHERSCERIFASLDSTTSSILKKIRILLLPLDFLQGHLYWNYPANLFSVGASQVDGYDKLLLWIDKVGKKDPLDILAERGDELTIRITKHSKQLDLAGCQQTTVAMLFRAVLQDLRKNGDIDPQCYISIEATIENILRSEGCMTVSEPAHVGRSHVPIAVPSGVDEVALAKLLNKTYVLRNLILGNTKVDDNAIFTFEGTSLEKLDLRETQVTQLALAYLISRNSRLKVLNIRGCKEANFPSSLADEKKKSLEVDLQVDTGLVFDEIEVGWGFADSTWKAWKPILQNLKSLYVGLGGSMSEMTLCSLSEICPHLEHLALSFQSISDKGLLSLLKSMKKIRMLELSHCLGEISSKSINMLAVCYGSNLTSLRLEWGVAWLRDRDICLLTDSCKGLRQLSLLGCKLLTSRSLQTISHKWRGMIKLHLQECGKITSDGASCLFVCKALQQLVLWHNGSGLQRGFAVRVICELPLLQSLCLDLCDSVDKGFDTPQFKERRSLNTLKLTRCKALQNPFGNSLRRCHKDTVLVEWNDVWQRTTIVKEYL